MYAFLDYFFLIFHTLLIFFNLFAWIWKPLRKANLITLLLTGASWFLLGIFYGIGYCPLTEWHWQVLHKLGVQHIPNSYVKYLIDRLLGTDINATLVEYATMIAFLAAVILSLWVNFRMYLKRKTVR
jgi:Flp pilus assembly pilin Flp